MNALEGTDGNNCEMKSGLEYEANEVREEAQCLEADTRETERETLARAGLHLHDVAPEVTGLYEVLNAAGTLISVANERLSAAPSKSALRSQLRDVVESASKIVNDVTERIRLTLTAVHTEPPPEKDKKSTK